MKLLFLKHGTVDPSTDSAAWVRALIKSAKADGLTVDVAEPTAPSDLDTLFERFKPDAVLVVGNTPKVRDFLTLARARWINTVVALADLDARDPLAFENADAVLVPSLFASRYYAQALGLRSTVVPAWVDPDRAIAERRDPRFVTFVDPSAENGAYVFARIADELGKVRPEIPLLIVGTRGSGATLAACGINIFERGNVNLMERTEFPRDHWQVTRLALIPSLAWDASPRKLAEAMIHGIPTVTSNRGALPEVQAGPGATLAIPDRFTPVTRTLPTPEEVAPWVEAIIRLWDASDPSSSFLAPAPGIFETASAVGAALRTVLSTTASPSITTPIPETSKSSGRSAQRTLHRANSSSTFLKPIRSRSLVLVPYLRMIERACEQSLRKLEEAGVQVIRSEGCPAIDIARNSLASDALSQGAESIFFIDADIGFDPLDALRLLARPEPVISGVYPRKRRRALASTFAPGTTEVEFGSNAAGPYPLQYAAGGFLRIKAEVLIRMITELNLPECNTEWGRRDWPFFQPLVTSTPGGKNHYLGEDWAFSHRLHQIGITPLADTTIRLWHHGPYAFGWEDAGAETPRHPSYRIKIDDNQNLGPAADA